MDLFGATGAVRTDAACFVKRPYGMDLDGVLMWFGVPAERTVDCVRPVHVASRPDGYYDIRFERQVRTLHSLIVERQVGRRSSHDEVCRHLCGHPWCVNPEHLLLGSAKENMADQTNHGTRVCGERHPRARLTDQQVVEIRALLRDETDSAIARRFGVSRSCINDIRHRRRRVSVETYAQLVRAS
jgi:hypothetical protein